MVDQVARVLANTADRRVLQTAHRTTGGCQAGAVTESGSVRVRPALVADAEGIARVHTWSWQVAYRGLVPDDYLDTLAWEPRAERWRQQLAEPTSSGAAVLVAVHEADTVQGFAAVGPTRDNDLRDRDVVELHALYLAPTRWRWGVGTRLLQAAVANEPAAGKGVALWVLTGNDRGRHFYHQHGFAPDGASQVMTIGSRDLEELRYQRPVGPW